MSKTLVFIRHGHRDNTKRELDNGLSEKGQEQAKAIRRFFLDRFSSEEFKQGLWFVSSPKKRCVETLMPTAKGLEQAVDAHPDLDEQNSREGAAAFEMRISRFLGEWAKSKIALTVVCSHGDWLPMATQRLLGLDHEFKKGGWLELESQPGDVVRLKWYVPSFKLLYK